MQNVLGDASIAVDIDLSPLIGQLTEATAELKAHGQSDGLVKKLEHAVASLQGVQSLQKVKPTLLTAQQQVWNTQPSDCLLLAGNDVAVLLLRVVDFASRSPCLGLVKL